MDTLIDYLSEARSAHRRNDWRASYAAFVVADGIGAMPTDDLAAYGAAAWRLGYASESVRLTERVYDRLVRTDPAAAAMTATELGLKWHARGHDALSRLWADRARSLLTGVPAGETHGRLAYLDAVTALATGDAAEVARAVRSLHEAAANTTDATLALLTRAVDGSTALQQSRLAEAYRLLDEALLPVVDERIAPEWAGDVYRLVLRSSGVDVQHRTAWTESMRRWVVITGVVMESRDDID